MYSSYEIFLVVGLIVSGSINTISVKWADTMEAPGRDGTIRKFHHPFVQSLSMFLGEFLCLIFFKLALLYYVKKKRSTEDRTIITGNQNFNPFILFFPAMCDMISTTVMYIGLNFTYASSFQMLRGGVIIFTALLSKVYLKRNLTIRHWLGIFIIIIGLATVGTSDLLLSQQKSESNSSYTTEAIITGDVLIFVAQIITAAQMVYEEKYVVSHDIPSLQVVGWEGVFGFVIMSILLVPFYYINVGPPLASNSSGSLEDFPDAIVQIMSNGFLFIALIGNILSIAYFNFVGISVTKEISATTRMVLDSVRTFFIWTFSLVVGWQAFHFLQPVGFIILFVGMCTYNNFLI
ncbi:solute carrier family 35 member F6-like [Daktulosphaira vitifoliae]|uniref:solute carrier family 35 member F6-like n=1 Tax=Daktulosphaira vitifoliae TaxID=58002 RepID=UPI0021AA6998|nr:solute carrier family 35 member F6-like [Daktulosphaira vitifoliae]